VGPFVLLYGLLFALSYLSETHVFSLFAIPAVLLLQLLVFLVSKWSLHFKLILGYDIMKDVTKAKYVFIETSKYMGKNRVEPLMIRPKHATKELVIADNKFDYNVLFFQFQNLIYGYCKEKNKFERESYPNKGSIHNFLNHKGHHDIELVVDGYSKWGANVFEIPIPLFLDLYVVCCFFSNICQHILIHCCSLPRVFLYD
jgi:hypothetical protein